MNCGCTLDLTWNCLANRICMNMPAYEVQSGTLTESLILEIRSRLFDLSNQEYKEVLLEFYD